MATHQVPEQDFPYHHGPATDPISDLCPVPPDDIYDVLIIGAGPCGLAVAARLREQTPAAVFTDSEHQAYHWFQRRSAISTCRKCNTASSKGSRELKMAVLDATTDRWLGRWDRMFSAYDISHLRSPVFWHIDPRDRDSLFARAHRDGRAAELLEICDCIGSEANRRRQKKRTSQMGKRQRFVCE